MLINLVIISKACWDILAKKQVDIENTDLPVFLDLLEQIYDLYPHLDADTDFKLLWQYTPQGLLPIKDFITFNAMLKLIGSNSIYVLVNDVEKNYKSTRYYLRMLDKQESRLEKLMSKTKYDVMFPSKKAVGCECSDIDVREGGDDDVDISDEEIIGHALRHEPVRLYWTADQIIKQNVIESIKKGWPKEKKKFNKLYLESEALEAKLKKAHLRTAAKKS